MKRGITDVAASVHARLINCAKENGRSFNELLQYYAIERFLFRLSKTVHRDRFVLKGGLMLPVWGGSIHRATKDIDFLGESTLAIDDLIEMVRDCAKKKVEDDGLHFDAENVTTEEIRLATNYGGTRLRTQALLGKAVIAIQIDIGFGDAVTPGIQSIVYPTLLNFEAPQLRAYPPETAIAEKLHAIVVLDLANTRLKDYFDIWTLMHAENFDGTVLRDALEATFFRRNTTIPSSIPPGLSEAFSAMPGKNAQWKAYLRKARVMGDIPKLADVVASVSAFLQPVLDACAASIEFQNHWPCHGPWKEI